MSKSKILITTPITSTDTPRARRGAAGVFAQYIQDLTQPSSREPRPATA
jgi:hypothetical protein